MATLTISHHLYLTDEQGYSLHDGKMIEIFGVAIPVWFHKGNTSEPAQEVFCKYKITNDKSGPNIICNQEEFIVNMPHIDITQNNDIKIDELFKKSVQLKIGTSDNLLDIKDGGNDHCDFKLYHKLEINKKLHHLIHFFEMKKLDSLLDSLD
jgi:hypothetical protein